MEQYDDEWIVNVGVGEDLSIRELAELVAQVVGFGGELRFDAGKPDGTPGSCSTSRACMASGRARAPRCDEASPRRTRGISRTAVRRSRAAAPDCRSMSLVVPIPAPLRPPRVLVTARSLVAWAS